jgi:hypothetical protein
VHGHGAWCALDRSRDRALTDDSTMSIPSVRPSVQTKVREATNTLVRDVSRFVHQHRDSLQPEFSELCTSTIDRFVAVFSQVEDHRLMLVEQFEKVIVPSMGKLATQHGSVVKQASKALDDATSAADSLRDKYYGRSVNSQATRDMLLQLTAAEKRQHAAQCDLAVRLNEFHATKLTLMMLPSIDMLTAFATFYRVSSASVEETASSALSALYAKNREHAVSGAQSQEGPWLTCGRRTHCNQICGCGTRRRTSPLKHAATSVLSCASAKWCACSFWVGTQNGCAVACGAAE